jgi:hypothetical protein
VKILGTVCGFETGSILLRLDTMAFSQSVLRSIHVPGSVLESGEEWFLSAGDR